MTRVAVVGHVEWMEFARVPRLPAPGDIVHASEAWEEAGGGGAVAAVQLAKLGGGCDFFTALGDDERARRSAERLAAHGVRVHAAARRGPQRRGFTHIDGDGERTITVIGERIVPHGDDPLPWELLSEIDGVYFTGGDPGALRAARRARALVATPRADATLLSAGVRLDALVRSGSDAGEQLDPARLDPPPRYVVTTAGGRGGTWEADDGSLGDLGGGAAARAAARRLRRRRLVRGRARLRARRRPRDRGRLRAGRARRRAQARGPRPLREPARAGLTSLDRRARRDRPRDAATALGLPAARDAAEVVAPAHRPRRRVGQRQAQARRRAPGIGILRLVRAAAEVVAVIAVVVAQPEEPHQPYDQRADVEDAQSDHEDPPFERHLSAEVKAFLIAIPATRRRDGARSPAAAGAAARRAPRRPRAPLSG